MKKNDATRIRLGETERKKLEEIATITGLPISSCIRATIVAFIEDFKKNNGKVHFPVDMDSQLRIWSVLHKDYAIPSYVDTNSKLEKFLTTVQEHWKKCNNLTK